MGDIAHQHDYTFETAPEVIDKIHKAENLHEQIPEESVSDLEPVACPDGVYTTVKRLLDIILSIIALVVLILPMAIIALIIWIDDHGKVIFSQYRVGLNGKRFKLYKFRTMKMDTPKYVATMELHDPDCYITRVGKFLRKFSLDEIPQLFNVVKGDMSLVGPRPLISDEYEIHSMRMHFGVYNIRPGATGLAQINGRDKVSPEEKVRWDVQYVKELSFWLDFKILLATVPKVFDGHDVVEGAQSKKKQGVQK